MAFFGISQRHNRSHLVIVLLIPSFVFTLSSTFQVSSAWLELEVKVCAR